VKTQMRAPAGHVINGRLGGRDQEGTMAVSTTSIRSLLGSREDSEHSQVFVRLVLCSGILLFFLAHNRGLPVSAAGWICLGMMVVGMAEAVVQFLLILRRPAPSHARRIVGMVYDYTAIPVAMVLMDEVFAFAWGLLLWVTVGNGLRYGSRYLFGAVLAAGVGFGAVILSSDYWQAQPGLAMGLLLALVAVPLYQAGLLLRSSVETQRMRRASEAKSRFLANMSHELRTPLNTIVVSSELLLSQRVSEQERPELAHAIHTTSQSMISIVQEVLDLAEIGAGKITVEPEPMDLSGLLSELRLMFKPLAAHKGIALEVGPAPALHRWELDLPHLRQVLVNVIGNAVKFTDRGGVRIDCTVLRAGENGVLRFEVNDTGVGMDQATLDTVYSPFMTGKTQASGGARSSGLGMTIVKSLVDALGGSIVITSTPGYGTRVTMDIPGKELLEAPVHFSESPSVRDVIERHRREVPTRRIMVVDDQPSTSAVVSRLLQAAGHVTEAFYSVERALDAYAERPACLVLVDLNMPEMSGLEFARQLRLLDGGSTPAPVILMTGESPDKVRESARASGIVEVLQKPLSAAVALPVIERLLRDAPPPRALEDAVQGEVDARPDDNVVRFPASRPKDAG
jgi:two-component system, sensor histidine kinase RpfC